MDGNTAAVMCERESSDAAGAYPITPSTQMGEYWAEAAASGHLNISNRPLIFIEPEGEHAAAAVTAGLAMTGLRSANFSSGQGIAYMHESLYAAVGKRLTYVLNIGARAMTKSTLNVHAGHDDYHCVDDTGFFQLFAKNAQHVADLNIIAHYIAEHALNPGIIAQDGFLTTHLIESMLAPERELIATFLGKPDDIIETPTPAQKIIFGETRRRIPELWDVDNPVMAGIVQNQDSYMQSVAAQRPFFFDHIREITDRAFDKFYELTGRRYARVMTYRCDDAEYVILGQGSVTSSAEAVSDYLRESRQLKVGVVNLTMFRPFPADLLGEILKGKKGVAVLERLDQPLASDLPLMREIRATLSKCIENGYANGSKPWPELATYKKPEHIPQLYSGSFGMGSRDLQAEGLIAAIENMLPEGKQRKLFYLGIDFLHDTPFTPKQEIYQQTLHKAYPGIAELALHGSENPNLMPDNSITVRIHSVGGWGAITTGKNLAMTLFELLGYHIKANPKYGSEKKGQPTTYYLSAAPEPIRMNCEYYYVDAVISPDPNVFNHTNALAGLKDNGVFIIQSEHATAQALWDSIPANYQKIIRDKHIKVASIDAFKIAREEATDPDLQLRMQGTAFQGAFFAASSVMEKMALTEETLLTAIKTQLQHKFGAKGARVVEDNLRVVKRGFDETRILPELPPGDAHALGVAVTTEPALPIMLKHLPQSQAPASDIHRLWEQTGNFYLRGKGNDNLADPFISMSLMPAASAVFRDMTSIRFTHPQWIPENCTACGECYTVCPDTAIPGLVNEISQVLDTIVARVKRNGHEVKQLPKAVRLVEKHWRSLLNAADEKASVNALLDSAIETLISESKTELKEALQTEFAWFREALGGYQFALARPHYTVKEKKSPGSGGLFSITINPYTCKGCQQCIEVCNDDALRVQTQTPDSIQQLRNNWNFWLDLPTTPKQYIRVDNLEQRIGALQTILLDKHVYSAFTSGDGACMGCAEKTIIHLFTATVEALMQPRVAKHIEKLTDLLLRLEQHIEQKLVREINIDDTSSLNQAIAQIGNDKFTLARLARQLEALHDIQPIDPQWLKHVVGLISRLKDLKWKYTDGITGKGRTAMGIINSTGCSSVWGSTYPFNPYPFPWANHLFQDSPSMAMGVFEGHMTKMAQGFKAVREAELELGGNYNPAEHENFFRYFTWQQFSNEEFALCPPVVAVGGDGAMYDIGFQNLSRMLMSGKPIKALVLDTQVYSNTGGQASTASFAGQISDMAPFGKVSGGKQEVRKEIGLIAMAHRTAYVLQSTIAHANHMIEGFIEGLLAKRPAVFNCYSSCQPEHGIGDDMSHHQAKLAVESRAYPLFHYHPDKGAKPEDCFDLTGNPAIHELWPMYKLRYLEHGKEKVMELPMTFADFAMTETRFRKHFRTAAPDSWHENMILLSEYLELPKAERQGKYPFIWTIDRKQNLSRLLVDDSMVMACEDRRHFWIMLKAIAGIQDRKVSVPDIEEKIRQEIMTKVRQGLMQWISGGTGAVETKPQAAEAPAAMQPAAAKATGEYMAPWIDSEECTACGECIKINPNMFAYDDNKHAYIKDPNAGSYQDLVKAAERCTAQIIHPGLPKDRSEKDIEQWIKRGEKYN
ncbi:MAG: 2-oxoacid:acceptor oxidoreductase family protein [Gammaproteobacteria bacterium]|nr:2-oxoacid:acceptor oxidoreductase family protein [Gammaproteobacteria bacterium]